MAGIKQSVIILFGLALTACGAIKPLEPEAPPAPPELSSYAPEGKLPGDSRPLSYKLSMTVDPTKETFAGRNIIRVALDNETSGIWLHGDDLRVSEISVRPAGSDTDGAPATWEEVLPSGVARIGFDKNYGPGEVELDIRYEADFDANLAGLFKVEEQGEAYALAKSESIQARRYLPGYDEPAYKAPFDITLTVPMGMTAVSNAPVAGVEVVGTGYQAVTFETTRPLPTYLLSLAVGPFDIVEMPDLAPNWIREKPVPLRGLARKGRGDELKQVLDATGPMLATFEEQFGQPYPYKKLDIIAAPQWPSGATELAGAITYRESRILLDDESGPSAVRAMLEIHAHELAHMWFGNLVTPPWWDDLWLKEAFATWSEPVVLNEMYPQDGYLLDARVSAFRAMRLDSLASTRAVREDIDKNDNIRNAYDSITYQKGMAVIAMMDFRTTGDLFRKSLGEYVVRFEDGVAAAPDFYGVIGELMEDDTVTAAFESFIEQKGVPLIEVSGEMTEAGYQLTSRQSRYAPLGSPIETNVVWTIPYCHNNDTDPMGECSVLDTPVQTSLLEGTDSAPAWIMPNTFGMGYYRFNMPEEMWLALAADFDRLPEGEQLAAIDSAVAMFEAGKLGAAPLLAIFDAAVQAEDRRVVSAPLAPLSRYGGLLDGDAKATFAAYGSQLYAAKLEALSDLSTADAEILGDAITGFLVFDAEDAALRKNIDARARAFIGLGGERDTKALTSDQYIDAFRVMIQDGGEEAFYALADAVEAIDDPRFEQAATRALGAAREPMLAAANHSAALEGVYGARETYTLIQAQMRDPATREATWDWLRANFPAFVSKIPRQWPRRTPGLAASFCDTARIPEVEALFAQHSGLTPGYEKSLAQTTERIKLCAALKGTQMDGLVAAMADQKG